MDLIKEFIAEHPAWLPGFIFFARITDVSLGTFRTICVVRGLPLVAAALGFCESGVWLVALSSVMAYVNTTPNPLPSVLAYAGGFATGNIVGMWLESRLALGSQIVRLISRGPDRTLARKLREAGYIVTELSGRGRDSEVSVCFVAAQRRAVPKLMALAREIDPDLFITVEDVRSMTLRPMEIPQAEAEWSTLAKKK